MPRNFDRTRSEFIKQKVREEIEQQRTGKVIRVYERSKEDANSNFEADVKLEGGTRLESVTPVATPAGNSISVPKVGDSVLVGFRSGEGNPPIIVGFVSTTVDRPPLGKAGMYRNEFESADSPAGSGNLYMTGYTSYDGNVAQTDKTNLTPEETFVRMAKRPDTTADPSEESAVPAQIEFYDAPAKDEAHITVELNKRDSADSAATWGLRFDLKTGEVKLVDPSGYGFVSDGDGNWTWEYESKSENQVSGGGSLTL
jgi:hypothetical protein